MQGFNPKKFVEEQIKAIKQSIGDERALVAVSGGVDSSTCAVLTRKAIGDNLVCVFLDDAFMREGEPEMVVEILAKEPLNVPVKIVNVRERFLKALEGLRDAEEKRKRFRETFYNVLSETARKENCSVLVQGTIRADVVETVGGVKTQHNVLEQMGINPMEKFGFKVVEPLKMLYKWQVRMVARHLGLPSEISERQPFPGPGLSVRVVGEITREKLEILKKATDAVEGLLAQYKPSQYFAFIMDNIASQDRAIMRMRETVARFLNVPSQNIDLVVFRDRATGLRGGKRIYGRVLALKVEKPSGEVYPADIRRLLSIQTRIINENPDFSRVLYAIKDTMDDKPYIIGVRAIETEDFLTAKVSELPWSILDKVASVILSKCPEVSTVYYDVTPKPPATIEME
ncbi:GMP synthase [Candidatus Bathyarchaeota archaeon]|nr:GMP synthase [Candidatus Bathyarchaeota archaeon]